jgi:16S rRNA (cytidine1402-2'-O)-methyltransferase
MPRPERAPGAERRLTGGSAETGPAATGTLYVVATPIGNLEDITLRALRVLREVALIAAEDTRRTANLLRHYEIRTSLVSVHEHNERQRTPKVLARLEVGDSVALVTDAGTPGISDPGAHLVAAARERGFRVEPIPGPSSLVTALSVAGQPLERFAFLGFPPARGKARKMFWKRVLELPDFIVVVFEAPHRLHQTLLDIDTILVNRPITIARELTKAHEEIAGGSASELLERFAEPRGEITVLIAPSSSIASPENIPVATVSDSDIADLFGQLTEIGGGTRREAIRSVAEKVGLAPKEVYQALERIKNIGH